MIVRGEGGGGKREEGRLGVPHRHGRSRQSRRETPWGPLRAACPGAGAAPSLGRRVCMCLRRHPTRGRGADEGAFRRRLSRESSLLPLSNHVGGSHHSDAQSFVEILFATRRPPGGGDAANEASGAAQPAQQRQQHRSPSIKSEGGRERRCVWRGRAVVGAAEALPKSTSCADTRMAACPLSRKELPALPLAPWLYGVRSPIERTTLIPFVIAALNQLVDLP